MTDVDCRRHKYEPIWRPEAHTAAAAAAATSTSSTAVAAVQSAKPPTELVKHVSFGCFCNLYSRFLSVASTAAVHVANMLCALGLCRALQVIDDY